MKIISDIVQRTRFFCLALLLVMPSRVQSQGIAYHEPSEPIFYSLFFPGTLDFNLDLNADGQIDFLLRSNDPGTSVANAALIPQGQNGLVMEDGFVAAMNEGESISHSLRPLYQWTTAKTPIAAASSIEGGGTVEAGHFVGKVSGFMGFDLITDGRHRYGWLRVSSPNEDAAIYANVIDWAFETDPNTGITVAVLPEPGAISLLGLGAALFFTFKHSRKK